MVLQHYEHEPLISMEKPRREVGLPLVLHLVKAPASALHFPLFLYKTSDRSIHGSGHSDSDSKLKPASVPRRLSVPGDVCPQ